jgi:hypothetical protein
MATTNEPVAQPPSLWHNRNYRLLQMIGAIPTVLIYADGLAVLAAAMTLNRHVRAVSARS